MAFTDFNSPDEVQKIYQITYAEEDFLQRTSKMPSDSFLQEFEFNNTNFDIFTSEASRCETVIYPLLREACKQFVAHYSLWSHKSISVNTDQRLSGTPDYIIAQRSELGKNVLGFPLILVVEAKQNNFTKGWGQCLAEMVAAQELNQTPERPIYGIVTDAEVWQFGKLTKKVFTRSLIRATIDDIPKVFGTLHRVMELATK